MQGGRAAAVGDDLLYPDLDPEQSGGMVRIPERGGMLVPKHKHLMMVAVFSTLRHAVPIFRPAPSPLLARN